MRKKSGGGVAGAEEAAVFIVECSSGCLCVLLWLCLGWCGLVSCGRAYLCGCLCVYICLRDVSMCMVCAAYIRMSFQMCLFVSGLCGSGECTCACVCIYVCV